MNKTGVLTALWVCSTSLLGAQEPPPADPDTLVREVTAALEQTVSELDRTTRDFIVKWNDTAGACNEVYGTFMGNLRSPCRAVRMALRRGVFRLQQIECYQLGENAARAVLSKPVYQTTVRAGFDDLQRVFIEYERSIDNICGMKVDENEYPDFAELYEQARRSPSLSVTGQTGPLDASAWWDDIPYEAPIPPSPNGPSTGVGFGASRGAGTLPVIGR